MAARELWLLGIFGGQLVADAVEELDVALLGVLLERVDKCPGHGTRSLRGNSGVGTAIEDVLVKAVQRFNVAGVGGTHDV